jgi:hypothetical protein
MKRIVTISSAVLVFLLFAVEAAGAQGLYPSEWWRGDSGLFSQDYVTPADRDPGFLTGAKKGKHGIVFGAATVDSRCQHEEAPRIKILSPTADRVSIDLGSFVATRSDAGSSYCLGRTVVGTVLRYEGKPARGEKLVFRVQYPAVSGRRSVLVFNHEITLR